jgi:hypothetical protein
LTFGNCGEINGCLFGHSEYAGCLAKPQTSRSVRPDQIENAIKVIRGQRVMLDCDLEYFTALPLPR